jgi:hypothetical protein
LHGFVLESAVEYLLKCGDPRKRENGMEPSVESSAIVAEAVGQ